MRRYPVPTLLALTAVLACGVAAAGSIDLGRPRISDQHYEIPVILRGADGQASAMDFTLEYDPAVFRPVSVAAGPAALQANKQIMANSPAPGRYIVVMSGINQNTVDDGEVARVTLERIGDARGSSLRVTRPTLAAADGSALSVSGGSRSLGGGGGAGGGGEQPPGGEENRPPAPVPAPLPGQGDGKGSAPSPVKARIGIDASAIPQELGELVIAKRPSSGEGLKSNGSVMESGTSSQPIDSTELPLVTASLPDPAETGAGSPLHKALDGTPRSSQNRGAGAGSAAGKEQTALASPSVAGIESKEVQNGRPISGQDAEAARPLRQMIAAAGFVAAAVLAGGGLWTLRQRFFR